MIGRVQVFYELPGGEKWSNVYHSDGSSLVAIRIAWVTSAVSHLTTLLHASCVLTKILVSDPDTSDFTEATVNEPGTSAFTDSRLPFFNSVKALFQPNNLGRPDYKFYKGWLTEALNDSGSITPSDAADFETELASLISDMADADATLCSENGDVWMSAVLQPTIQMRQMHRKRRHVTP